MADTSKYAVELTAKTADFEAGMARASASAAASAKRIENAFANVRGKLNSSVGNITALLGAGFGAAAFVGLIKGSIDAQDHLNDLSKSTGLAVDVIGGLGFAAAQSGSDVDETAKAFGKLQLKIASAIGGNEEAIKTFRALDITLDDLKKNTSVEILGKAADKFRSFDGDANKAALGVAVFSKSYSGIAPLLDDGGDKLQENIEYFKKFGGVTKESAQAADDFNDAMVKLKLLNGQFARTLTGELIGPLQTLANLMVENKEKAGGFNVVAADTAALIKGVAVAALYGVEGVTSLGRALGANAAAIAAAASGDFARAAFIRDEYFADQEKQLKDYAKIRDAILFGNDKAPPKAAAKPAGGKKAPSLGSGDADAAGRSLLDQRIKALEESIREEKDVLKDREQFLQMYYQDDQLSIKEYFTTRQGIILDALDKEIAAYDQEIAALQDYKAKANPKDRIDAETKIAEVVAKRARAQNDASVASVRNWIDEQKAVKSYQDSIEDVSIALAALNGDTVTAGLAGFDKANQKFRDISNALLASTDENSRRLGEIGAAELDKLRARTGEQLQLNKLSDDFGLILDRIGNAQASVAAKREAGTITELEALSQLSNVNASRIGDLQRLADAYQAVGEKIGGALGERALVAAEALRREIERLAATGDLVAKKFNDIFVGAFAEGLADVVDGTKSVKDAFKDMERSIVQSITKIAAQNLAEKIFGGSGGVGSIFSGLFGGSGGGASGGVGGGFIGDLFIKLFGAANGTDFAPGGPTIVGERGIELVNLPRGAQVIPNHKLGEAGGMSIVNNFTVTGQTSRASQQQVAARASEAVSRAARRR